MKRWLLSMIAAALVAGPVVGQKVETKSGGIIVKKVIKNGKVVDEKVEVFGDLDEDEMKKHLGRLKKHGKKHGKSATKRDGAHSFQFRFETDDGQGGGHGDLGAQIRKHLEKALQGIGKDVHRDVDVVIRGLGKSLKGHLGHALKELEELDVDIDIEDLHEHLKGWHGKMGHLHEHLEKHLEGAKKHLKKGEFRMKFGPKVFYFGPDGEVGAKKHSGRAKLFLHGDVEKEVQKALEGLDLDDHIKLFIEKGGKGGVWVGKGHGGKSAIRKLHPPKKKKKSSKKSSRGSTDATIDRLERQLRDLQRELDALRGSMNAKPKASDVKTTSVWL